MNKRPPINISNEGDRRIVCWQIDEAGDVFLQHDYPDAVKPHYSPSGINEDMLLYSGGFHLDPTESPFRGNVWWRWNSPPRIEAEGHRPTTSDDLLMALEAHRAKPPLWRRHDQLSLEFTGGLLPSQPTIADTAQQESHFIIAQVEQSLGDGTSFDSVRCLIPNGFQSADSTGICDPEDLTKTWRGRSSASGAGWDIIIDQLFHMDHNEWKTLKTRRGWTFTHAAEVRRSDGASFDGDTAFKVMDRVRIALNIALGRRTTCALPVGYRNGSPIWCRWRSAPVDHYTASSHWLDESIASSQIRELLGRTLEFTSTPAAYSTLKGAVSYYMAANNDVTVELKLPLVVSALQMLSYYRFVVQADDETKFSQTKWKNLGAERQLRLLLADAKIDLNIPDNHVNLRKANSALTTTTAGGDALWTVVKMRNVATHPTKELPYETFDIYAWGEAGILARQWLCFALLKTIGFNGSIARRNSAGTHWTGDVSRPPWVEG